jgi:hypothetical protein
MGSEWETKNMNPTIEHRRPHEDLFRAPKRPSMALQAAVVVGGAALTIGALYATYIGLVQLFAWLVVLGAPTFICWAVTIIVALNALAVLGAIAQAIANI